MKLNYELIAKFVVGLFSIVWVVSALKAYFIAGFSLSRLLDPMSLLILLVVLVVPVAVVWALFLLFDK